MPKFLSFLSNAKIRNLAIILSILILAVLLFGIYWSTRSTTEEAAVTRLPEVPGGVELTSGAKNLPSEYLKTLIESNKLQAEQALKAGQSSIPILVDTGVTTTAVGENLEPEAAGGCYSQCVTCCKGQESSGVLLNDWVKKGNISAETAAFLSKLQDRQVTPSEYAAELNRLVREGKLTPEQAQQLLAAYQKEYEKRMSAQPQTASEATNQLLSSGAITPAVADELRKLTDSAKSSDDYARNLNRLVAEGKLTQEQAKQLLSAYRREKGEIGAEVSSPVDQLLDQWVAAGSIDPQVADQLRQLSRKGLSPDAFAAELNKLVRDGKLTSEQARQLSAAYNQMVREMAGKGVEMAAGALVPAAGGYDQAINQMQQSGAISPAVVDTLNRLKGASAADYASELNRLVKAGQLSPEAAQKLLDVYRKQYGDVKVTTKDEQLANLERAQQQQILMQQSQQLAQQEQVKQTQQRQVELAELQRRQQNIQAAIGQQVQSLLSSWTISPQTYVGGGAKTEKDKEGATAGGAGTPGQAAGKKEKVPPIVKAGTIMFAVLDTGINSDQPGPIMATIVSGLFKGGKILGSLTKTPDGQRVMLQFNTLSLPDWPETVAIDTVAINPDTAKTAIASSVDNHYLLRYGSLFASSFIAGYAQGIQSGGTTTLEPSGTQVTTGVKLNPKEKIFVGLGAVGTKLSQVMTNVFMTPPTVKVEAGTGIGILFRNSVDDFRQTG